MILSRASVVIGAAVAILGVRSFFVDDLLFLSRAIGTANDGTEWAGSFESNRGTFRFNLMRHRWHEVALPNPFLGDTPLSWVHRPASPDLAPIPGSVNRPDFRSWGFDVAGFGIGHAVTMNAHLNFPSLGPDFSVRTQSAARVPHWLFALAFLSPLHGIWKTRRVRRRLAAGLCAACGYDLRASKDRCPECGCEIKQKP
jgi:hypothetical protein